MCTQSFISDSCVSLNVGLVNVLVLILCAHSSTLCGLYSLGSFTDQLPSENVSLKGTLEKCITEATHNWFRALDAALQPQADVR